MLDDTRGVHEEKFKEQLAISQRLDGRNKPQNIGYNGDRSDGLDMWPRGRRRGWADYTLTVNGVTPT